MLNKTTNRYAFELTDHLGGVRAIIAKNVSTSAVDVLSYTDYYAGCAGVLPGRSFVSSPSYKFNGVQGNEKDAETNFTNFELRQYDPRLMRWFNPDPMGQYFSPYLAMGNNPVSGIDPTGGWNKDINYADYMDNGFVTAEQYQNYAQYYDPMMDGERQQGLADIQQARSWNSHLDRNLIAYVDYMQVGGKDASGIENKKDDWASRVFFSLDGGKSEYKGEGDVPNSLLIYIFDPNIIHVFNRLKPGNGWDVITATSMSSAFNQLLASGKSTPNHYQYGAIFNHSAGSTPTSIYGVWMNTEKSPSYASAMSFSDEQTKALGGVARMFTNNATIINSACHICMNPELSKKLANVLIQNTKRNVFLSTEEVYFTNRANRKFAYPTSENAPSYPNGKVWLNKGTNGNGFHKYYWDGSDVIMDPSSYDIQMNPNGGFNFNKLK
jgi:RHS repeat-associated protein